MLADYMYQERSEEEDLPALKRALTHQYSDNDYIEKHKGLITVNRNDTDNTNRMTITGKQKLEVKQLYGRFKRIISNIPHEWT